ncbi:MAG TPA: ATP-binding protein [Cyclobacteriaceae bacterium]|nr:ATP-binding protein [Cyclobacteriaceae bacterium]HMV07493.1 ATP-binding protein [Cyclobacteriaceae bacterium]HMW99152.1 ATP-binding protein [Cyclobacteriaceae bacterium]HMX48215.1 ATP-binding protein [Cyclobacteriaceae bacterium]HMY95020.1 ATP-binding protein [Cyclobacteriaceae bacterium]
MKKKSKPTPTDANPFLGAISEKLSFLDFAKKIRKTPPFLEQKIPKDPNARKSLLKDIKNKWFHVTSLHYEVYECFHEIIETRFQNLVKSFNEILENIYEWNDHHKDRNFVPKSVVNNIIDGFTIIGPSGLGKTLTVNTILQTFFPQVIIHERFKQLVYLKVNCTSIGSTKSLCFLILHEFDKVLGTKYFERYSTATYSAEKLIPVIADLCHLHRCACLIIDECNHLSDMKGQSKNQIIGFLKNLNQAIGLPIVYIGTPEALPILAGNLQIARRSQGIQSIMWDRYQEEGEDKKEDKEWGRLLKSLWTIQVLFKPGDLTPKLRKTYYRLSQGVLDVLIKLHVQAQKRALSRGLETIDENLLEAVAKDYFALTNPMINAIRSKNSFLISQYRDISMDNLRIIKQADGPDELTRLLNRDFSSDEIKLCMQVLLKKNPELKPEDLIAQAKSTLDQVKAVSPAKAKTGRKPTGRFVDAGKSVKSKNKHEALVKEDIIKPLSALSPNKEN